MTRPTDDEEMNDAVCRTCNGAAQDAMRVFKLDMSTGITREILEGWCDDCGYVECNLEAIE